MKYDLLVTMADLIGLILAVVTCRPDIGVVLLLKGGWCSVCRAAKLDGGVTPIKYFSSTFLLGVAPVVK